MNLLEIPDYMIEEIFGYLSYDEIAKKRLICTKIDKICQGLLNRGFNKMVKRHGNNLKAIKSQLPRRESERRHHPLSKHVDILTCIETRISMLSMTYLKYIELELCCFIPGKVIDEVFTILDIVQKAAKPLRTHEVLQELRDISSMAIEHFDEKIAVVLKKKFLDIHKNKQSYSPTHCSGSSSSPSLLLTSDVIFPIPSIPPIQQKPPDESQQYQLATMKPQIVHHCVESKKNNIDLLLMKRKYRSAIHIIKLMRSMQRKQSQLMKSHSIQISELSTQIIELKRRIEESDAKNRELSNTLNESSNRQISNKYTSNIKPRTATIILKKRINESLRNNLASHPLQTSQSASSIPSKRYKPNE